MTNNNKSHRTDHEHQAAAKAPNGVDQKKVINHTKKTWYNDAYSSAVLQRNFFILIFFIFIGVIVISILTIRYIKNTQTIEPFVIEIEKKSGVPTVIRPLDVREYSANRAVKESLIVQYIRAREGYAYNTYYNNYYNIVKIMSAPNVYYQEYRPIFSMKNTNSPYNILGQNGKIEVKFKSIIFLQEDTAQVRVYLDGSSSFSGDKVIVMSFAFQDLTLSENERFINPLGFTVTSYQIANESLR